ncbi:putative serine protease K12H4.7 [Cloeon dipterum]|uniref:putative serine protease K12H4.7 n=1 Tax=Cloeon dipterum TaxID=197152 RepID=UPI00321FF9B8
MRLTPIAIAVLFANFASAATRNSAPFRAPGPPLAYPPADPDDRGIPTKAVLLDRYVEQKLDHTNPNDARTWFQRYLIADEFYTPGGPVFVFLSGPWKIDGEIAVNGSIGLLGRDLGAVLIDLEHRFYGKSKPTESLTIEDLAFLTIEQAISDIVNFATFLKQNDEMFSGPWILYGSGYSASLAAWTRAQHPDIFAGAYASCPRLHVTPYFEDYYRVVYSALEEASPGCGNLVWQGFEEMSLIVASGDSETLAQHFTFCDGKIDTRDPYDVQNLYNIATEHFGQEVETARVGNLTDNVCYWMEFESLGTPFEMLAFLVNEFGTCYISDYQEVLEYAVNSTFWQEDYYGKQWMYQQCSELGQFLTTGSTLGPTYVSIDYFLLYCKTVFGSQYNLLHLEQSAARLNELYGGLTPKGTKIVYTVASLDPWHTLGSHSASPESPLIMIQGASHSLDLSGPGQNDTFFVQDARRQVAELIQSWL